MKMSNLKRLSDDGNYFVVDIVFRGETHSIRVRRKEYLQEIDYQYITSSDEYYVFGDLYTREMFAVKRDKSEETTTAGGSEKSNIG